MRGSRYEAMAWEQIKKAKKYFFDELIFKFKNRSLPHRLLAKHHTNPKIQYANKTASGRPASKK